MLQMRSCHLASCYASAITDTRIAHSYVLQTAVGKHGSYMPVLDPYIHFLPLYLVSVILLTVQVPGAHCQLLPSHAIQHQLQASGLVHQSEILPFINSFKTVEVKMFAIQKLRPNYLKHINCEQLCPTLWLLHFQTSR